MNSEKDVPHQPDTSNIQQLHRSFKPIHLLTLLSIIFLIAVVSGIGIYWLEIRRNQNQSHSTQSVSLQPIVIAPSSIYTPTPDPAIAHLLSCIGNTRKNYKDPPINTQLSSCKTLSGKDRRSCEEKWLGEYDTVRAQRLEKLKECYSKHPSYAPEEYPDIKVGSTFERLQEFRNRAAENVKETACIYVNSDFRKYRDDYGEYPKTLSNMIPQYLKEIPQNASYERTAPDKFEFSITLNEDEVVTLTHSDVFENYDPAVLNERCRAWSKQHSPQ